MSPTDVLSHYIPRQSGSQLRAACGRPVEANQHSTSPSCVRCAEHLAHPYPGEPIISESDRRAQQARDAMRVLGLS